MKIDIPGSITLAIALLLLVKALETIFVNILPTLIHGRTRLAKFYKNIEDKGIECAKKQYIDERGNAMLFNTAIGKISPFLSNYFYRWFILVPLSSIAMLFTNVKYIVWTSIVVITVSIIVEVINEVVDRLWNGIASNIHFNAHVNVAKLKPEEMNLSRSEIMKRISISLMLRLLVLWLGFSGIYCAIREMDETAFTGMSGYIDALYFSLVTVTTTGYGEILPNLPFTKLFVVCQISLSWILLLVMVLHYGTTLTSE